ncbi:unnamed protein product [Oppiella nova]|uniref:EF-hand domain-containing protein n=1 Tax=Oppiella nova TaxID=334625 RepID=A0A7R9M518_9ACAR|nr:unnamed protein product [Oppiella nova]CAG2170784.1 unnamed protein product [Oppiella nova]
MKSDIRASADPDVGDFWNWVFGDDNTTNEGKPLEHIKEELEYHYGINYDLDNKSADLEQEMDFHMFNLHDFDKNKLLDGLELLSMMDRHENSHHSHSTTHSIDQNIAIVDMLLRTDDTNNDGFLDYNEFKSAKSKHNIKGLRV